MKHRDWERSARGAARLIPAGLLCLGLCAPTWAQVSAAKSWEGPPFSADARELAREAGALPKPDESDSEILFEDTLYSFDAAGRLTLRAHELIRILTPAGATRWGSLIRGYSPWFQDKPTFRARIVSADGSSRELDQKTIAEEPLGSSSSQVFSDQRRLRAPLPGVESGCIVETEVVVSERVVEFPAGQIHYAFLWSNVPIRMARVVVRAPEAVPITHTVHLLEGVRVEQSREGDVKRLLFEARDLPAGKSAEEGLPAEVIRWPGIFLTTGRSWRAVSEAYAKIVDDQIRGAALGEMLARAKPSKGREATLAELTRLLHQEVRYTGVEFGNASIVPRPPAEVLQRKFGDCKDKAALLVAMLRASGLSASIALLDAGTGEDSDERLPGLGYFNHAIVYVPGPKPTWIDATAEYARPGELPPGDQDRLALIADGSGKLVRTPAADSSSEVQRENRDIELSESGPAKIRLELLLAGGYERRVRQFAHDKPKEFREAVAKMWRSAVAGQPEPVVETGDPQDLAQPMALRIQTRDPKTADTADDVATVSLDLSALSDRMPQVLRAERREATKGAAPKVEESQKRKGDYVFSEPFTTEIRWKIVPPPGFAVRPLPESKNAPVGTARYIAQFSSAADGTVTAEVRFESGKRRITAAEFEATRTALLEFKKQPTVAIRFDLKGSAYLAEGKFREALREFRGLAALHPKEALHRTQTALALLQAGLGEAARREAREGVALDEKSALAFRTLGWVLEHDLLGRRFRPGFDRGGALAALRKAKELDPSKGDYRGDLAILLEFDANGDRYTPSSNLPEAIEEYRALYKDLQSRVSDNLVFALFRAGRFGETLDELRSLDPNASRNQLRVAATAARDGVPAALREALNLFPDVGDRRQALQASSSSLVDVRRYPEAAALNEEAAKGSPDSAVLLSRAETLRKLKPYEQVPMPAGEPKAAVMRWIVAQCVASPDDEKNVRGLLSAEASKVFFTGESDGLKGSLRAVRRTISKKDYSGPVAADITLGAARWTVDGSNDVGFRVRAEGASDVGLPELYFVVRESGSYRILATDNQLAGVGLEVLRRLGAGGQVGAARQLLDWLRQDLQPLGGDDAYAGMPFPRIWPRPSAADEQRMGWAAASLMVVTGPAVEQALTVLGRYPGQPAELADPIEASVGFARLTVKAWAELLEHSGKMLSRHADSAVANNLHWASLAHLGRWDELERGARERANREPDDTDALRGLADMLAARGKHVEADKVFRQLLGTGKAMSGDFNNAAWNALFFGSVTAAALEDGRKAVQLSNSKEHNSLHTLATLYAETGNVTQARELLLQGLDAANLEEPQPADWFVLGRLAEQYGETSAAIEAYRKVEEPDEWERANSVWTLARKRMAMLGVNESGSRKRG